MPDNLKVNEAALAYKAERRKELRALSWEDKVALIQKMRDSLGRDQWKKHSRCSTGWSGRE